MIFANSIVVFWEPPVTSFPQNYKIQQEHFDQKKFLHDLDSKLYVDLYRNCKETYEKLSKTFVDILNHHTPWREQQIRGDHAPFMTKELSKGIMEKLKTRNKYLKWSSRENYVSYKKSENKCNSFIKKEKLF